MNVTTGIQRLDRHLKGGIRRGGRVLLHGPSFSGKEILARTFAIANLRNGTPAIFVLTNMTAHEARGQLGLMDSNFHEYEARGLVWFADAYSRSIGAENGSKNVLYVDSPADLAGLDRAIVDIQQSRLAAHSDHVLVVDSTSTLAMYTSTEATCRFLQVMVGRSKEAGATSMLLLDQRSQGGDAAQMFSHVVDGLIEMRLDRQAPQLQVRGLSGVSSSVWLDYRYTDALFEITGSLAAGRIR